MCLRCMDDKKAQKIQEKEKWSKALKQANGEKVRDHEKLLKKALKRQEKTKKSKNAWWVFLLDCADEEEGSCKHRV
ncbi:hypothetical protein RUND412_009823 [Rhizina undulata]